MTPNEFKEEYPQYSHLEGDALWDMMVEVALQGPNVLTADPNREMHYLPPVKLANGVTVQIEDSSKTVWLDKEGNEVKYVAGIDPYEGKSTESYKFIIWDASK